MFLYAYDIAWKIGADAVSLTDLRREIYVVIICVRMLVEVWGRPMGWRAGF